MDIVDARTGQLVTLGQVMKNSPDPSDWYSILRVRYRTLFTRTAEIMRHDGTRQEVVMPVKVWPKWTYGPEFPSNSVVAAIYPS